jgi:hypothetical protein
MKVEEIPFEFMAFCRFFSHHLIFSSMCIESDVEPHNSAFFKRLGPRNSNKIIQQNQYYKGCFTIVEKNLKESMWVSLRRERDSALAKKAPRVMISIKFLFLLDSLVNFTRACQFWSQLINQKK